MADAEAVGQADEIRAILDAAPFPLLISRMEDGTVLYANDRAAALLELKTDQLVGSKTPDLYADPEDRKKLVAELESKARVTDRELRIKDPAGRERWALISVAVATLRGETVLVSGLNEITQMKQAELALAVSERKFRGLVENANDLIYMLTPDGIFSYASPNWAEILGKDASEILGKSFAPLIHPDDLQSCYDFLASVVETGDKQSGIEYRVRHADGSWRWHTSNASCLKDVDGNVQWFLGIARDITEKKEAQRELERALHELRSTQAQLVQAEKLAAVSNLIAGVSHELNSPIGAIHSVQSTLQIAVAKLEKELADSESDEVRKALAVISDADRILATASERVSETLTRLRSFAKLDEAELKRADIHEGIENTLALLQRDLAGGIDVVRDYGRVPPILCYPAKLNQVFLNVFTNAIEAIGRQGTIRIRTFVEDDMAAVAIRDTGPGIPPEQLESIFEPSFATKRGRVATGLGLPICYQIVQQHEGELLAESQLGVGSVFTVKVPLRLDRT